MTRRRAAALGAIAFAILAAAAAGTALLAPSSALDRARQGRAVTSPSGVQVVDLVAEDGVYAPNVVHVRAGAPLRLRVTVRDRHACETRLLVPDLGVDLALVAGGTAEVTVPAPAPGAHVFTCAMKMVKGTLVVE